MSDKLLPCPFCGGEVKATVLDAFICSSSFPNLYTGAVSCYKCRVGMHEVGETQKEAFEKVVRRWNTRVERTCGMRSRFYGAFCYECSKCGHGLDPDWKHCPGCGAKVVEND